MRALLLLILAIASAVCMARTVHDEVRDAEAPVAARVAPASRAAEPSRTSSMLLHALSLVGVKYKFGGSRFDTGFDCSGFVRFVFAESLARDLPRSSVEMSRLGVAVDKDSLQAGDLLFYNTLKRRFSHVAIYLGEGRFVHAPSRGKRVEIVDMTDAYWQRRFNGARRIVAEE